MSEYESLRQSPTAGSGGGATVCVDGASDVGSEPVLVVSGVVVAPPPHPPSRKAATPAPASAAATGSRRIPNTVGGRATRLTQARRELPEWGYARRRTSREGADHASAGRRLPDPRVCHLDRPCGCSTRL